ncbi:MAG: glycine cleavage T C-terminal barrel domain-containing protein, partial [Victivallaceae bacterium]
KDGRAFIGRRNLSGATQQIVGLTAQNADYFELLPGAKLFVTPGEIIGEITSSGYSYDLKRVIALAHVADTAGTA